MPRRSMLTAADREILLALPESDDELIRHYTFSETDRALIRLRRGDANRLGFAVQLCFLRYPGHALAANRDVPDVLIHWVATELWLDSTVWKDYGERAETRREHLLTLRAYLELTAFTRAEFRRLVRTLTDTALQIDKGSEPTAVWRGLAYDNSRILYRPLLHQLEFFKKEPPVNDEGIPNFLGRSSDALVSGKGGAYPPTAGCITSSLAGRMRDSDNSLFDCGVLSRISLDFSFNPIATPEPKKLIPIVIETIRETSLTSSKPIAIRIV